MPTSVFGTSWRKVIGSFRSSQGHLLPAPIREQLFEYIVLGVIPPNPLKALLANDLATAFSSVSNQAEATRLHTMWEFIRNLIPTGSWRSYEKVAMYPLMANTRKSLEKSYEIALKKSLRQSSKEPILID
jgi:hypothetical protein